MYPIHLRSPEPIRGCDGVLSDDVVAVLESVSLFGTFVTRQAGHVGELPPLAIGVDVTVLAPGDAVDAAGLLTERSVLSDVAESERTVLVHVAVPVMAELTSSITSLFDNDFKSSYLPLGGLNGTFPFLLVIAAGPGSGGPGWPAWLLVSFGPAPPGDAWWTPTSSWAGAGLDGDLFDLLKGLLFNGNRLRGVLFHIRYRSLHKVSVQTKF